MARRSLDKLVIFGVGLIGGSFALAVKRAGLAKHVVGVGRSRANMEKALRLGVIDELAEHTAGALRGADLILLALPVGQMRRVMRAIAPYLETHTVVTDAGSTKQDVVAIARECLAVHLKRFVPAHPVAGAELSGVGAASADLFVNKNLVLTPLAQTDKRVLKQVKDLWEACGARVSEMTPRQHDEIFAAVSHLPHLLAYALMDVIASKPNAAKLLNYAASGFRDFTRIAGSSPEMWRDIALANRTTLLNQLSVYQKQLKRIADLIRKSDGAALENIFTRARNARAKWLLDK
ncbi:MAG TPA: prephenate dehydrogenase/arogenate dehydrogenase family protein [Burkholderiales bacterium]|nr:prephenate dehydrogenase/arogenate dehydrogenase family protein [Burkholderiales bacterium]